MAEYIREGSAVGDSMCIRLLVLCYRDAVGAELDFKQAFNSFKYAVKAFNTNAPQPLEFKGDLLPFTFILRSIGYSYKVN